MLCYFLIIPVEGIKTNISNAQFVHFNLDTLDATAFIVPHRGHFTCLTCEYIEITILFLHRLQEKYDLHYTCHYPHTPVFNNPVCSMGIQGMGVKLS